MAALLAGGGIAAIGQQLTNQVAGGLALTDGAKGPTATTAGSRSAFDRVALDATRAPGDEAPTTGVDVGVSSSVAAGQPAGATATATPGISTNPATSVNPGGTTNRATAGTSSGAADPGITTGPGTATGPGSGSFLAHFVYPPVPFTYAVLPTTASLQTAATNCATGAGSCAGLSAGLTTTCTYPSGANPGATSVGLAMWEYAAGQCRYAIALQYRN